MMILRFPDDKETSGGSSTPADVTANSSMDNDKVVEAAAKPVAKEPTLAEIGQKAYEASVAKDSTPEKEAADSEGLLKTQTEKDPEQKEVSDSTTLEKEETDDADNDKGPVPYERFREINETKKQFEDKVKEYEPMVQAHKSIVDFCQTNAITEEEFRNGMEFLRLSKTDPAAAKAALQPVWDQLSGLTGDSLPADLAQEVEDGTISAARAKELAKLRGQTQFQGAKTQMSAQAQEKARQSQLVNEMSTSISAWSASKSASDPAFKAKTDPNKVDGKYEFVADRFYKLMGQTPPKSAADAIKLIEQAYSDVSKSFAGFTPRINVASKGLSSTKSSASSKKEPTSIQEVVQGVLARHKA